MDTKCIRCTRPRIENLKICVVCQQKNFERLILFYNYTIKLSKVYGKLKIKLILSQ